ncbi:SPOR domain-containing protein [Azospirillum sp.]|uniref:SPOR domain-containing protein n=1 Tax=Azospirillum sp. TaxID=34012 RepID=UPI003D731C1A
MKPLSWCLRLLPFAILLAASTAVAAGETFDAGTAWRGNIVRNGNGALESCAVMREFDDDSVLSFALTREQDFFMIVSNPRTRMPPGGAFGVRYMVDDGVVYQAPAEAMRQSVVVDLPDNAALRELLGNGHWLYLNELGDVGYSLQGAKQSLRAMADCVTRQLAAETGPVKGASAIVAGLASGGVVAELDLYASEERARVDWLHMKTVMGGLLDGREPLFLTRTRSKDGRSFTLLRVGGFAGRDEAAQFCAAMRAKKQNCVLK